MCLVVAAGVGVCDELAVRTYLPVPAYVYLSSTTVKLIAFIDIYYNEMRTQTCICNQGWIGEGDMLNQRDLDCTNHPFSIKIIW